MIANVKEIIINNNNNNKNNKYLAPGRRYASRQLSELTTVAFHLTFQSTVAFRATKILSTLRADIPVAFRAT